MLEREREREKAKWKRECSGSGGVLRRDGGRKRGKMESDFALHGQTRAGEF